MKKKSSKEAKFFCESCGSEVPRNSKFCPLCGKFFAAVRCPQCGKTGSNDDFKNGCPDCGYAFHPDGVVSAQGSFSQSKNNTFGKEKNKLSRDFSIFTRRSRSVNTTDSLPIWVYISSILVLAVLVVILYSCL